MNRSFLGHYNNELYHLRQVAAEFAREFPKIAGRLSLDQQGKEICPDPFVERLLEGFAFMAARVQMKLDAEFPRFTQSLLETVYPHYVCPTPSMAVARMDPDPTDEGTPDGFLLPRGTSLSAVSGASDTPCEFRTVHDVLLWPLRVESGQYLTRDIAELDLPNSLRGKAAFRLRLRTNAGVKFNTLNIDRLPVFVRGLDEIPGAIFEQIFSRGIHVVVKTSRANGNLCLELPKGSIRRIGIAEEQALLPFSPRGFEGYRLLQEYFALPQRFLFFEFTAMRKALSRCDCDQIDLVIVLNEAEPKLERMVDASCFELFCTPVINLFSKRLDPISLVERFSEFHVVADRTRPLDYEIYQIQEVIGHGSTAEAEQPFQPFYLARDENAESAAYFTAHRVPRTLSEREKKFGATSSYAGSEVYVSLVDGNAAPFKSDLSHLGIMALCTNRHLPIQVSAGQDRGDFTLNMYAPVAAVRCVSGPTLPVGAHPEGEMAWRIISHLSLNYLSLLDEKGEAGAVGLREMLKLYCDTHDTHSLKQIEGIRSVSSRPVVRRVDTPGPLTFARGLELKVVLDEHAFQGTGIFMMGSVLERFFAKYVSLNSFTETVIESQQRGEIIRWPAYPGKRQIL